MDALTKAMNAELEALLSAVVMYTNAKQDRVKVSAFVGDGRDGFGNGKLYLVTDRGARREVELTEDFEEVVVTHLVDRSKVQLPATTTAREMAESLFAWYL